MKTPFLFVFIMRLRIQGFVDAHQAIGGLFCVVRKD
jgi:hypothetical protein